MRLRLLAAAAVITLLLTACGGGGGGSPAPDDENRADGARILYRATGRTSAQNPAFSPDGKSVLFTLFHDGYNEGAAALRVVPLGSEQEREHEYKYEQQHPRTLLSEPDKAAVNLPGSSWHPRSGVAFASDRSGQDEVWIMEPGGKPTRVTRHRGDTGYLEPSFSPDGQWIVFQESVENEHPDGSELGSLWEVRRDGSGTTRLIDGPGTRTDNRQPNWSPTGDRLVFQRREAGSEAWALYVVNADGSGLRRLTTMPGEHTDPSWSPDGRSVVFSSTSGGLDLPQIFVIPASGGRPTRVTRSGNTYDGAPSWSPDGRWIAFESHPGGEDRPSSLWRVPAPHRPIGQT
ncbi:TolB family protein [Streptomyces sp. NPDC001262]|uniref:TolB family protein n=1 Tax=Streptomyces sp. NPDC001262 TaxID=3364552 RepID=UPI0036A8C5C4